MADLAEVEARLRRIFDPFRHLLTVTAEGPAGISLELPGYEGKPWGYVGGTRVGKAYVSVYLMGLYDGALADSISPELRKRMQGKTCFNFTRVDEHLTGQLETLAALAIRHQPEQASTAAARRRT